MTDRELAEKYGVSIRTIARYRSAGIDLANHRAVEQHKFNQRSRRGVSKINRRAVVAQRAVDIAKRHLEGVVLDLENRICGVHSEIEGLLKRRPQLATDLADTFGYTTPVVKRIGAEE